MTNIKKAVETLDGVIISYSDKEAKTLNNSCTSGWLRSEYEEWKAEGGVPVAFDQAGYDAEQVQLKAKADAQILLREFDWKLSRHTREERKGIPTALSEGEFQALLDDAEEAARFLSND